MGYIHLQGKKWVWILDLTSVCSTKQLKSCHEGTTQPFPDTEEPFCGIKPAVSNPHPHFCITYLFLRKASVMSWLAAFVFVAGNRCHFCAAMNIFMPAQRSSKQASQCPKFVDMILVVKICAAILQLMSVCFMVGDSGQSRAAHALQLH